jgi:predicted MPP superfamily phosphohydrolase
LIELYAFQAVKTLVKTKPAIITYQIISFLLAVVVVYLFSKFDRKVGQTPMSMFTFGLFLIVYIPKILISFVLFGEDIVRVFVSIFNFFSNDYNQQGNFPSRRKFVSQIGLGLAAIPFFSLIYGMTIGKFNFKVIKQPICFSDLPDAFDGFTITQISDIHSGSFDNPEKIEHAIDLINQQNSDLILFTGDIVNTHAAEMLPWLTTFNKIQNHKYGKFAVLGNHDYGEYVTWDTNEEKEENFQAIKNLYGQIGFDLLLNEHKFIEKDNQKLAIVGVENWGQNFKKAGDIEKASTQLSKNDFKILMSHDPSHWEYEIKDHSKHFQLTLSGHTHGMQFGIEIPGFFKWSPVQYIYKQWAGLYENLGRNIYVNRGFGFHAYAGRVGIMPEITQITLKKK